MGANVSTTQQQATSVLRNVANNSCTIDQSVTQKISNVSPTIIGCTGELRYENNASLGGTCDMSAIATGLAEASMSLSEEQTNALGIGLNVSDNAQERASKIENAINQKCGGAQAIKQTLENNSPMLYCPNGEALSTVFLNTANAELECVQRAVNEATNRDDFRDVSNQTNKFSVAVALGAVGIVLVVVIMVTIIGVVASRTAGETVQTGFYEAEGIGRGISTAAQGVGTGVASAAPAFEALGSGLGQGAVSAIPGVGQIGLATNAATRGLGRLMGGGKKLGRDRIPIVVFGIMMFVWYTKMTE